MHANRTSPGKSALIGVYRLPMSRQARLFAVAAILGAVALTSIIVAYASLPYRVRVAVGPRDSDDYRIISELARLLSTERRKVRLSVRPVDGAAAAAVALDAGQVELAVIRSDVKLPNNGQTVAIMHHNAALLIVPKGGALKSIAEISGKTIGFVRGSGTNRRMLDVILAQYGVGSDKVRLVPLEARDVGSAIAEKRVEVVMAVGSPSGPTLSDAVAAATRAGGGPPTFLPVPDAEAIAQRYPAFHAEEILQGAFGGAPPAPEEAFTTLAASYLLMARRDMSESATASLTRLIFALRPNIATRVPLAIAIQAPESDKAQVIPVHPGTIAYLSGEELSFFDRYGDWIYLGIMVISLAGSAGALMVGALSRRRIDPQRDRLKRVLLILSEARSLGEVEKVLNLRAELDMLVADALADPSVNHDEARLSAFALAVSTARSALSERSSELANRAS